MVLELSPVARRQDSSQTWHIADLAGPQTKNRTPARRLQRRLQTPFAAKNRGNKKPAKTCVRAGLYGEWWSWGDLNPRPQAFFEQFYMCSRLI
jgi:hypothetical protein